MDALGKDDSDDDAAVVLATLRTRHCSLCLALHRCDANDDATARCCDAVPSESAVHAGLGHRCAAMQQRRAR